MADDKWYRSADWDAEAQDIFYKKLKRARGQKAFCALVKARFLYNTREQDKMNSAKTLLQEALIDLKDEEFDLPNIAETLCRWYLQEEAFENAEIYIRQYFELVNSGKVPRVQKGAKPEELLAELSMLKGSEEGIKEAIALVDGFHKKRDEANKNATPYVPQYEVLESMLTDMDSNDAKSMEELWDDFEIRHSDLDYDVIHGKNQKSLDYLWKHLSESALSEEYKVSSYSWYRLEETMADSGTDKTEYKQLPGELFYYIPELGAYIGQILVNTSSGSWELQKPLIKSRIVIGDHTVNPFLIAYYAVNYHFPIKDVIKRLEFFMMLIKINDVIC